MPQLSCMTVVLCRTARWMAPQDGSTLGMPGVHHTQQAACLQVRSEALPSTINECAYQPEVLKEIKACHTA